MDEEKFRKVLDEFAEETGFEFHMAQKRWSFLAAKKYAEEMVKNLYTHNNKVIFCPSCKGFNIRKKCETYYVCNTCGNTFNTDMIEQSQKIIKYNIGEIVRYTGYESDLINYPKLNHIPDKFFKVIKVDMDLGVVDYGKDSLGISNIRKTTFIEKIIWWLFW